MTDTTKVSRKESEERPAGGGSKLVPRIAVISACVGSVLVVTGFGKIAIVPIALTLIATIATPGIRRIWWAAAAFAVVYSVPFIQYAVDPNRAPSLSKDMHPAWWVIIPLVGLGYVVAYRLYRGRSL